MVLACALLLAGPVLRVSETAGIRRFSYPVTVKTPWMGGGRLLENGKPVPAQFRHGELDLNVSLVPTISARIPSRKRPPKPLPPP